MAQISSSELRRLRAIEEQWNRVQPALAAQDELLAQVRRGASETVAAREELEKRLKAELAHYRASAEAAENRVAALQSLVQLFNVLTDLRVVAVSEADVEASSKIEGNNHGLGARHFRCSVSRNSQEVLVFHLTLHSAGSVLDYRPIFLAPSLTHVPEFFREEIEFKKDMGAVFFREVLKAATQDK
jgi:hypothetical protein